MTVVTILTGTGEQAWPRTRTQITKPVVTFGRKSTAYPSDSGHVPCRREHRQSGLIFREQHFSIPEFQKKRNALPLIPYGMSFLSVMATYWKKFYLLMECRGTFTLPYKDACHECTGSNAAEGSGQQGIFLCIFLSGHCLLLPEAESGWIQTGSPYRLTKKRSTR